MSENDPIICAEDVEEMLRVGFVPAELEKVESFMRPLCETARLYLARIFVRAKSRRKNFDEIMSVCEALWKEDWQHGTPDRLADPDDVAPGGVGMRNVCAFYDIYRRLGLPFPKFLF